MTKYFTISHLSLDPCEEIQCGSNAECKLINGNPRCLCARGYEGSPGTTLGCSDVNECLSNPCGFGAICKNELGRYSCECPSGFEGNAAREGCVEVKSASCDQNSPCPHGEQCVLDEQLNENVCVCQRGFIRDEIAGTCRDVNECTETNGPVCGLNAVCKNIPGSYECQCPPEFVGNPFSECKRKYHTT